MVSNLSAFAVLGPLTVSALLAGDTHTATPARSLELKLLATSVDLAKQKLDIEQRRSLQTPRDHSHQRFALERLRSDLELAQLRFSHAKSQIMQRKFDNELSRRTAEQARTAKAEYDDALALDGRIPGVIGAPEVNRLRLEWQVAAIQAELAKLKEGIGEVPRKQTVIGTR